MAQHLIDPASIKANVREHYGEFARAQQQGEATGCCSPGTTSSSVGCGCGTTSSSVGCGCGSGCCSSGAGSDIALYDAATLGAMPAEIAGVTRGCGNPIALATLRPGEVVLDLGSGGGLDVLLAAQQVGPDGYVYGVDMTDEMLFLALKNAAKVGATNVGFLKGEIEAIPLPDHAVDVIISNCVINLSPEKGQALREAFRVLKPGGRLAVSDIVIDGALDDLPVDELQVRAALSWAGCIAGALTADEYRRLLVEAGFARIELTVTARYSGADILPELPPALATIERQVLDELASRFTSMSISAYRSQ
jgi:arsenite methyltransferase